jgi:hypothetical protein
MDTSGIVLVALLVIAILVIAFLYRRGSFEAGMEALGAKLNVKGRGQPETEAGKPAAAAPSPQTAAKAAAETAGSGERSIHVGRDARGAFVTGDNNRVAQVQGDRNRVDQTGKG